MAAAYRAACANGRDDPRATIGAVVAERAPICAANLTRVLGPRWISAVGGRGCTVIAVIVINNTADAAGPVGAVVEARHVTAVAERSCPVPGVERDADTSLWTLLRSSDNLLRGRRSFGWWKIEQHRFRGWRGGWNAIALQHVIDDGVDSQLSRKKWHKQAVQALHGHPSQAPGQPAS